MITVNDWCHLNIERRDSNLIFVSPVFLRQGDFPQDADSRFVLRLIGHEHTRAKQKLEIAFPIYQARELYEVLKSHFEQYPERGI